MVQKVVSEFIVPKGEVKTFKLNRGQVLRVKEHEGPQVASITFLIEAGIIWDDFELAPAVKSPLSTRIQLILCKARSLIRLVPFTPPPRIRTWHDSLPLRSFHISDRFFI